jgi:hypothetical protein
MSDREHEPAMSASDWVPEGTEWDWMPEEYPSGIRLMFVRGVTPEHVIEAFEADPAAALMISAEAALETMSSWFQVGRAGEWAFAIDNSDKIRTYEFQQIMRELSLATDLALFETGPNMDHFYYFVNGDMVTSFEPLLAHYRSGSDPDRFVPQMRLAGLSVEPPPDDRADQHSGSAGPERDPRIALLEMLTLALGIRLPREVALGPLCTVQPGPAE